MNTYKGIPIQEIVADTEWQALRKVMVGHWKSDPDTNIELLRLYKGLRDTEFAKVRIYNYLTGTAFRMGIIKSPEIDELKKEVKEELKSLQWGLEASATL